jgi:hypothetical protein
LADDANYQAQRLARKARLEMLVKQILRDAKIVARWRKKPFYVD